MNGLDRVYQKNQNFVFRQIDDETLLVPIKDSVGDMGSIYNLNSVGAFVWQHLDGQKPLQDIKNLIEDEFEVSGEVAEQDLTEFVAQLEKIDAILRQTHR
ncbi:MAG: PqqD family protein [Desulfobacterales bacterium]|nr:PqqD family protein [Desulfobacterales bacterium]